MAQLSEATIQLLRDRETILAIISHRNEHGQSLKVTRDEIMAHPEYKGRNVNMHRGGVYVGSRLAEVDLVRSVQRLLEDHAMTVLYDWTAHGSLRGRGDSGERLPEISVKESLACAGSERVVFLLATGETTRQAGLHVELGAFLGSAFHSDGTPDTSRRALLWTPPEHAHIFDPLHRRCLTFYFDPRVDRLVCPRDEVAERVRAWLAVPA